jgi:DNA polymerase III alpha subunit
MNDFGRSRPALLWELKAIRGTNSGSLHASTKRNAMRSSVEHSASNPSALPNPTALIKQIPSLPDYDRAKSVALERETLNLCVAAHPLTMFEEQIKEAIQGREITRSVDLARHTGQRVELLGWRVTVKGTRTMDKMEEMIFATFSDRFGRYEAVFFPDAYRRTARALFKAKGPFIISGRVESDLGAINLTTENIQLIGG